MEHFRLPEELQQFLREKNPLTYAPKNCEVGKVSLEWLEDLELSMAWVDSEESPLAETDPHAGEPGHYEVPCVSLLFDCQNYEPWGVLCWFPKEQQFGTVDSDHNDVFLFGPEVGWKDIVRDPVRWLNYQWEEEDRKYFVPFPQYPFIADQKDAPTEDPQTALNEARAQYQRVKEKFRKRGVKGKPEQLLNLEDEIEALEAVAQLPQPPSPSSRPSSPVVTGPAPDLSAVHEQTLAQLEGALRTAPQAQQAALEMQLQALRQQVAAFKQKHG